MNLEKIYSSQNSKQLTANLCLALAAHQIKKFAYTFYGDEFHTGRQLHFDYVTGNLKKWHKHFHAANYETEDTIGKRVRQSLLPLVWDLRQEMSQANKKQRAFYQDAIQHGLQTGISIPTYGPNNQFSILVVHLEDASQRAKDEPTLIPSLILLAQYYQQRLVELLLLDTATPAGSHFSKREWQCIKLTRLGLDAQSTADELGIKKRTVDFHWQNINSKVGAKNKFLALQQIEAKNLLEPVSNDSWKT